MFINGEQVRISFIIIIIMKEVMYLIVIDISFRIKFIITIIIITTTTTIGGVIFYEYFNLRNLELTF